ncbi:protein serine/threonine phosphatase 2C [Xylariomycetidae sp. FL2044]|nr:protein serine/threonine phosphatase 2C [Xylariomycetidae sp. FL2044]
MAIVASPRFVVTYGKQPLQTCIRCQTKSVRPSPASRSRIEHNRSFSVQPVLRLQETHTMRKFTYHVAASFSAKYNNFDPTANIFHFSPYNRIQTEKKRPKSKRPASGQDAFFISRVGDTNAVAFGVADGVGGWEESGVDPADFSHSFCDYMASAAYEHRPENSDSPLTARGLMQRGYDDVCKDKTINAGGSTASVAIAREDGILDVANLGDSGFVQLRLNAVNTYSEPQTHAFNTPYQLSIVPASMLARAAAFGGAQLCDYPKDADVTEHELKHGDILVFASDGVWDNLFNQDILRITSGLMKYIGAWVDSGSGVRVIENLKPYLEGEATIQGALARQITREAKAASVNQRLDGPFAKEVQKYYPQENWHGGKIDDICVIVAVVSEDSNTPTAPKAKL